MTRFVYVTPRSSRGTLALSDVARIADSLKRGSLAVLPTETGYMLAAIATSEDAVKRAFAVKERATSAVMHIACSSLDMAGTVGIRVPDYPGTLQVINAVGSPLTATSLNSSGSKLPTVDERSLLTLNWPEDEVVYVVRDDDAITYGSASTLARISGESIEVLRPGPISESAIREVAEGAGAR